MHGMKQLTWKSRPRLPIHVTRDIELRDTFNQSPSALKVLQANTVLCDRMRVREHYEYSIF